MATPMAWDPLQLSYSPGDGELDAELPLRLLVIDDFSGRGGEPGEPVAIGPDNFDRVLKELGLRLVLDLENHLLPGGPALQEVGLELEALADFSPEALLNRVPALSAPLALLTELRQLKAAAGGQDAVALPRLALRYDELLLDSLGLGLGGGTVDVDTLDYAQAELGARLAAQLDSLLHHPHLQSLESAWRGLRLLVERMPADGSCRLDLMDVDKQALEEDFLAHIVTETRFYQRVYDEEFGQFGGRPYGALICGFAFEPTEPDLALLRGISAVAAFAHAPFVAAAGPRFFGVKRFDELSGLSQLAELHRGPHFARWRGFTEESNSRYIALTLPRILLRAPYEGRDARTALAYREDVSADSQDLLWGSAAYAFAGCLFRSFGEYRVCVDIVGRPGGRVDGLPRLPGGRLPLEVLVSEGKEAELVRLGLVPLVADRADGTLTFYAAHSVHGRHVIELRAASPEDELGLKLGAQLPYLFLICRIAHYLKLIQRDTLGSFQSGAELQTELNSWLRRYVSDVENPEAPVRARRPLRRAAVEVEQLSEGWYRMRLSIVPHVKYLGQDYSLSLDGQLGAG